MAEKNSPAAASIDNPLVLTRTFAAPRALVFEAWSKPEHLEKWFGPNGFKVTCTMEFRAGGAFSVRMVGHGMDHTVHAVYREIVVPERISMALRFDDLRDFEFEQTITFAAHGDKTTITMTQQFPDLDQLTPAQRALVAPRMGGARQGWGETLDHLAEFVTR